MEDFEDYSIGARAELGMALVLERRYNSTEYGNGYTQCYTLVTILAVKNTLLHSFMSAFLQLTQLMIIMF